MRFDALVDALAGGGAFLCAQLSFDGGSTFTTVLGVGQKTTANLGLIEATLIVGSATDTWGRTWSTSEFSNANFRLLITNVGQNAQRDISLDFVAVQVTFSGDITPPTITSVADSPDPFSPNDNCIHRSTGDTSFRQVSQSGLRCAVQS